MTTGHAKGRPIAPLELSAEERAYLQRQCVATASPDRCRSGPHHSAAIRPHIVAVPFANRMLAQAKLSRNDLLQPTSTNDSRLRGALPLTDFPCCRRRC
jgi:hypothetical protein